MAGSKRLHQALGASRQVFTADLIWAHYSPRASQLASSNERRANFPGNQTTGQKVPAKNQSRAVFKADESLHFYKSEQVNKIK